MSINNEITKAKEDINNLDLSMIANTMVIKLGWLKSEVDEACALYRNFLFLIYKYPDQKIVPSEDIDEVWHNHILDTRKYKVDCEKIFGRYLDHYPYFGMDGITTLEDLSVAFAETQKVHIQEFGYPIFSVRYSSFSRFIKRLFENNRQRSVK